MADRIDFSQYAEEPDLREMSREALQESAIFLTVRSL